MADPGVVYGSGDALNQTQKLKISSHDQPLHSIFASAPSNSFLGSRAMVSFGAVGGLNISGNSFFQSSDHEESVDEYLDGYFSQQEKRRRLSMDQVQFLERSFEAENKLEPERKTQLAKEIGLQPRQVAVWYQNRRARWKTKQLETDYETLHASYKSLKTDYDYLLKENEKLKAEVLHLKHNALARDVVKVNSKLCDAKEPSEAMPKEAVAEVNSEDEEPKVWALTFKNEEQSSAKSDVTHADSPRLSGVIHSFLLESGHTYHFSEPHQSDSSQNAEDSFHEESLQPAYIFPNIEDAYCHPPANSCYYGYPVEDHAFSFWSY